MEIVAAETSPDHWTAWATNSPQKGYSGATALDAVDRLCAALGRDSKSFRLVQRKSTVGRVVLDDRTGEPSGEPCPDCGGSGRYVGFTTAEACATCGGTGRV